MLDDYGRLQSVLAVGMNTEDTMDTMDTKEKPTN